MAKFYGDNLRELTGTERLGQNRESEYLGAEDIAPDIEPVLTISGIYNGMVTLQRGKENKDVIQFVEKSVSGIPNVRPLIVNATNRKTLRKLYRDVTADSLRGKKIQLYIDHDVRDPQDGGKTDGIRIRPFVPKEKEYFCQECGQQILGTEARNAEYIAAYTLKKYGKWLCSDCATKAAEAAKAAEEESDVL